MTSGNMAASYLSFTHLPGAVLPPETSYVSVLTPYRVSGFRLPLMSVEVSSQPSNLLFVGKSSFRFSRRNYLRFLLRLVCKVLLVQKVNRQNSKSHFQFFTLLYSTGMQQNYQNTICRLNYSDSCKFKKKLCCVNVVISRGNEKKCVRSSGRRLLNYNNIIKLNLIKVH